MKYYILNYIIFIHSLKRGINPESYFSENSSCTATNLPSLKPFKSHEQDMQDTAGEVRTNSWDVLQGTLSYRRGDVGRAARTYLQQLSADT